MRKKYILVIIIIITFIALVIYHFNYVPYKTYRDNDFNIVTYTSNIDKDNDGMDDQSDILYNAKKYIASKPKYKSKYYGNGYPDDGYGVCTDVIAYSLRESGYDLRELVNEDIVSNKEEYNISVIDKNIDFRRVVNLKVYFDRHAQSLTTDVMKINEWQAGDIVIFKKHIGIISDKRDKEGIPLVIHHANIFQISYEEDILGTRNDIIGHYRIS